MSHTRWATRATATGMWNESGDLLFLESADVKGGFDAKLIEIGISDRFGHWLAGENDAVGRRHAVHLLNELFGTFAQAGLVLFDVPDVVNLKTFERLDNRPERMIFDNRFIQIGLLIAEVAINVGNKHQAHGGHRISHQSTMIVFFCFFVALCAADVAVKMRNIRSLVFLKDKLEVGGHRIGYNSGTRCQGDYCNDFYMPAAIVCRNLGFKTDVVDWQCETDTSLSCIQMQNATVVCDGFSSPDDPEISLHSCMVVYSLALVHEGCLGYKGAAAAANSTQSDFIFQLHAVWPYVYAALVVIALMLYVILVCVVEWHRPGASRCI